MCYQPARLRCHISSLHQTQRTQQQGSSLSCREMETEWWRSMTSVAGELVNSSVAELGRGFTSLMLHRYPSGRGFTLCGRPLVIGRKRPGW